MTKIATLLREAKDMPDALIDETLDFVRYLKSRYDLEARSVRLETTLLSESSLAKDWLRPEEDEAWADL
jgi:hypothetical protein